MNTPGHSKNCPCRACSSGANPESTKEVLTAIRAALNVKRKRGGRKPKTLMDSVDKNGDFVANTVMHKTMQGQPLLFGKPRRDHNDVVVNKWKRERWEIGIRKCIEVLKADNQRPTYIAIACQWTMTFPGEMPPSDEIIRHTLTKIHKTG